MATHLEGGHTESILAVDCTKDETGQIFTGAESGQLCHWHCDGSKINRLDLGEDGDITSIYCLKIQPDLLYCSAGEQLHMLDRRSLNKPVDTFHFNSEEINQVTVNEKEEYLATCDDAGQIKIFNTHTKKVTKSLRKHTNICASVAFRPKKPWEIISGGYDQRLLSWDFNRAKVFCDINMSEVGVTPDQFDRYVVNPPFIHSISISANGNLLACGTENALVQVFNSSKKTLTYMTALRGHTHGVSQVHFPKFDEYTLISGGNDGICNLWKLNTLAVTYQVNGYSSQNSAAASNTTHNVESSSSTSSSSDSTVTSVDEITSDHGDDDVTSFSPRPCFGIQHDEKINWITTGCTATRKFIVISDSSNEATVYNYPEQ